MRHVRARRERKMSRRSTRIKAEKKKEVEDVFSASSTRPTRRQSLMSNASSTNSAASKNTPNAKSKQSRKSIAVPTTSSSKKAVYSRKTLNKEQIEEDLIETSSGDEFEEHKSKQNVGKTQNHPINNLTTDDGTIFMKIIKSSDQTYKVDQFTIGMIPKNPESTNAESKTDENPKRELRQINRPNYGETDIWKKQEAKTKTSKSTRDTSKKPSKSNNATATPTKKRYLSTSKYKNSEKDEEELQCEDEGDENSMHTANCSPKRWKSETGTFKQTPSKTLTKTQSKKPVGASKALLHTPVKPSKKLKSTRNTNKKPTKSKAVGNITATPTKKRSLSTTCEDTDTEEDEEKSECEVEGNENLMYIANCSPKRFNSIETSKQTPAELVEKTPSKKSARVSKASYTPSKDFNKLSLIEYPSTPKSVIKSNAISRELNAARATPSRTAKQNVKYDEYDPTYDEEPESCDDGDNSASITDNSEDEDSEDDCSVSSDNSELYSQKRGKSRKTSSKNNLRTPSKIPKKVSMETPTKAFSKLCLTPSMHQRTANIIKPSTPLQEARLKLHVSVLPKSLPCREEQFNDIYTFLHARLSDKSGGCIYISGVPGTGKTATVNEVIRCLKKSMNAGKLTEFKFIDINGMKLSEPRQAYVQILKQLTGQQTTWEEAHKILQEKFNQSKSKKEMTLLLVDELDLLCTKRQDVVYNLLDWPSKTGAKLVVVTIANTMDLPERILMGKVTSRLGLTRLTFPPYNHKQLEEIVASRLRGHNAFSGETVQLVARKVAAVSGDARRALDICRRATEIAENNKRDMVSMVDVKQAVDEMIASPKIQAIKHCSDFERIFLQAVCTEVHRTGVEEVVFKNVYTQFGSLCIFDGEKTPNVTEALGMCARLGSWRLLLCDHSRMDIHQRILLNVSTDDVHFAIQSIED